MAAEPMAAEPMAAEPMAAEPMTEEPMREERILRMTIARLERQMDNMCTDQGQEGTCSFHAVAKIILHDVCEVLVDLRMTEEEKRLYQKCLEDNPIETEKDIGPYTESACSEKGFVKIMLFYYIYNFLKKNGIKSLNHVKITDLINFFPERIAAVSPLDSDMFARYKVQMLSRKEELGLIWKPITLGFIDGFLPEDVSPTRHLTTIMDKVIKPILQLNLYILMGLEGHGVVLANFVSNNGGQFAIKNSWGETTSFSDVSLNVTLDGTTLKLLFLTLMLPMSTTFSQRHPLPIYVLAPHIRPSHLDELYAFIPEYVRHYSTFRIRGGKTRRKRHKKTKRSKRSKKYI
jgi:hypothetical protein